MALDDVPPDEMHLFGPTRDPLDAALRGESDDPAVTALVGDLRSAYLPEGTRARSDALVAFAGTGEGAALAATVARPGTPAVEPAVPLGRRVAVGVAAFAATVTGKVVLGGAVAAAALGGLHASEVVDVPLLPRAPEAHSEPRLVPEAVDSPDPVSALLGKPTQPAAGADGEGTDGDLPAVVVPAPSSGADVPGPAPVDPAGPAGGAVEPGRGRGRAPNPPAPTPDQTPRSPEAAEEPAEPPAEQPGEQPPTAGPRDGSPDPAPGSDAAEDPPNPEGPPAPAEQPAPSGGEQRTSPRP
jgi:hypothetical protein